MIKKFHFSNNIRKISYLFTIFDKIYPGFGEVISMGYNNKDLKFNKDVKYIHNLQLIIQRNLNNRILNFVFKRGVITG